MTRASLSLINDTPSILHRYSFGDNFDEMFDHHANPRELFLGVYQLLNSLTKQQLNIRQKASDLSFLNQGITFTVYHNSESSEHIFPYDLIPRLIDAQQWRILEAGLIQRTLALNLFLHDIYHEAHILRDKVIPVELVYTCKHFRREMIGINVPNKQYITLAGIDIIRDHHGKWFVLEDNLRVPSGASYVLSNREASQRAFPSLFNQYGIRSVNHYPQLLLNALKELAPHGKQDPMIVLLSPGAYNSAYYEHSFLGAQMGVPIVEGRDLIVHDNHVFLRTTQGLQPVDVIYRRLDDDFLDPLIFQSDSLLGVPGLFNAFQAGNVALANVPGTGVADDKAIYSFVPAIIRYYLQQEPLIDNVTTYLPENPEHLDFIKENIDQLVIKPVGGAGGYGLLIGSQASDTEKQVCLEQVIKNPRNYIAQPIIRLSTSPCYIDSRLVSRHVDLRPFVVFGKKPTVLPGGLTRVALKEGSLVVNSSQGGGSKDTWVLTG